MEFWGVEVKPGQTVKCEPGDERYLHLSQASLGEIKKDKGTENVPVFVKFNDQKLVLGTLSAENCAQIPFDIVFEKEFELSHGSNNTSVFFVGYKSNHESYVSEDDLYGLDDEAYLNDSKEIVEASLKQNNPLKPVKVAASGKDDSVSVKTKPQTGKPDKFEKPKLDGIHNKVEDDEDEDDSDEESDDDIEEPIKGLTYSDSDEDEDDDDSSEDEEANFKAENGKKRSADGTLKTPTGKKTKVTTGGNLKTGGDAKKGSQTTTPQSTKQAGKSSVGDKAKQQNVKSPGSVVCKSCSKSFNSENALQSHTKAKHSGAK